jgi:hypothetical protein
MDVFVFHDFRLWLDRMFGSWFGSGCLSEVGMADNFLSNVKGHTCRPDGGASSNAKGGGQ